jgi:hypothetical protein
MSVATLESSGPGVLPGPCPVAGLLGCALDLGLAVAGQLAQLADRAGRHEAGADQSVLDQLGDPGRIGHVGLATRYLVQVGRVQQPALDLALQQLPARLPVAPGRLHPHPGHPKAGQPLGQQHQPGGGRGEPAGVAWRPPWPSGTRTHAVTESLCTSSPAHRSTSVSISSPPPGTPAAGRHPEEPLPGESESRARGNSAGARGSHVRLISGLAAPREQRRRPDDQPIFIRRGWPATAMGGLSGIEG